MLVHISVEILTIMNSWINDLFFLFRIVELSSNEGDVCFFDVFLAIENIKKK